MKQFLRLLLAGFVLLAVACQTDNPLQEEPLELAITAPDLTVQGNYPPLDGKDPLTVQQINRQVLANLFEHDEFRWTMVDDHARWSAVVQSDSIVSIGYQPEAFSNLKDYIHEIDVESPEWRVVREAIIQYIVDATNEAYPEAKVAAEDLLAFGTAPLPYLNIKVYNYDILAQLYRMNVIRYVEPMGYGSDHEANRSGSGCGGYTGDNVPATDYTTVPPGAKVPWTYASMNIQGAWNHSTGDNITIGLIDSGLSPDQNKLNGGFASGYSTGRLRQKYGTFVTGWWWWASIDGPNDDCGHGTAMAGAAVAPRTSSGSTVGVAYESNLVSYRGTDDVVINESREKDGVSDALYALGSRSDVKIVSMSIGDVFYSGQVNDAVQYAYNQGKLIFSAAGTSLSWTSWWGVIFPANQPTTVAVTGVKTGTPMQRCNICHDGSQVDFVMEMQDRNNFDRTSLTLSMSGNTPSYVGGSSVATATTAGVAALVWAMNPNQSRATVLQRMKEAGEFYPNKNGSFGYGRINAQAAVLSAQ
ncbi:MAG: S8/S53 family peptidase [Bacteroidota bacterium]